MATWKKYFKTYDGMPQRQSTSNTQGAEASNKRYSSWLPEVYQGQPNRVQRYGQYDQMDLDSEVNAALDIIAEFSTLQDENSRLPFKFDFAEDPTESENDVLQRTLRQWCSVNEMNKRIFRIFRNAIKYGDQIFVRDPETYKLFWVDPAKVDKVIVNEGKGKKVEAYYIKDIDINMESMNITADANKLTQTGAGSLGMPNMNANTTQGYTAGSAGGSRFANDQSSTPVDAAHVIHISLNEGIDGFWPFGTSILERILY